jgi:hypothetical protein
VEGLPQRKTSHTRVVAGLSTRMECAAKEEMDYFQWIVALRGANAMLRNVRCACVCVRVCGGAVERCVVCGVCSLLRR